MNLKYSLFAMPLACVMFVSLANAQSGSRGAAPSIGSAVQSAVGSGTRLPVPSFNQGTVIQGSGTRVPVQSFSPAPTSVLQGSGTRSAAPTFSSAPVVSSGPVYSAPVESYSVPSASYVVPSTTYSAPTYSAPTQNFSTPRYNTFRSGGWFGRRNGCGGY